MTESHIWDQIVCNLLKKVAHSALSHWSKILSLAKSTELIPWLVKQVFFKQVVHLSNNVLYILMVDSLYLKIKALMISPSKYSYLFQSKSNFVGCEVVHVTDTSDVRFVKLHVKKNQIARSWNFWLWNSVAIQRCENFDHAIAQMRIRHYQTQNPGFFPPIIHKDFLQEY